MTRNRNPQEFFEVFRSNEEKAQAKPDAPTPAPSAAPAEPKPPRQAELLRNSSPPPPPPAAPGPTTRNAEVTVSPGRVTVSLSHTGLVYLMGGVAVLVIVSFCVGIQYGKRRSYKPTGTAVKADRTAEPASEESMDTLSAVDMTPAETVAAKSATKRPAARPKQKLMWLQLISTIPKRRAEQIAKTVEMNYKYQSEVFKSGKHYGVQIVVDERNAERAKNFFRKKKEFKDCFLKPMER